ncbi:hypothetical protein PIB30_040701 [Stylosanthes scabra]|uniref:Uncharacterized protein n=1 Tax=Stylosanthes scabra TaxID=79078 RepID=A0ABU6SFH7_9FABA|nr:hypothetical protein [Stylosanthes scabra]
MAEGDAAVAVGDGREAESKRKRGEWEERDCAGERSSRFRRRRAGREGKKRESARRTGKKEERDNVLTLIPVLLLAVPLAPTKARSPLLFATILAKVAATPYTRVTLAAASAKAGHHCSDLLAGVAVAVFLSAVVSPLQLPRGF